MTTRRRRFSSLPTKRPAALALALGLMLGAAVSGGAVEVREPAPTLGLDWPVLGSVQPRAAKDIPASSFWSIGAETYDRGFIDYERVRDFVGPLGAKHMRVQSGWFRCEPRPGTYDWAWLDRMIDHACAEGVRPWLQISYGNPAYPGGGDRDLAGGLPTSPEALAAWDRWVQALVTRYQDRVFEWEIWNEPDLNRTGGAKPAAYLDLFVRTATIVRAVQPRSQIWALGLSSKIDYVDEFLAGLKARGGIGLIDAITIHGYPRNPDDTTNLDQLQAVIAKHGTEIAVRQGETGAPSQFQDRAALKNIHWTENTQAKWNLRRMLAHRARDVPMNLFALSDMTYSPASGGTYVNHKGLLATNPDRGVAYVKPAYRAAQAVYAIFDDTLARVASFPHATTALRDVTVSGYRRVADGATAVAYWFNDAAPGEANGVDRMQLTLPEARFVEPVLVDLRTAAVHAIPAKKWSTDENAGTVFRELPVYDSPLVIIERAALPLSTKAK